MTSKNMTLEAKTLETKPVNTKPVETKPVTKSIHLNKIVFLNSLFFGAFSYRRICPVDLILQNFCSLGVKNNIPMLVFIG